MAVKNGSIINATFRMKQKRINLYKYIWRRYKAVISKRKIDQKRVEVDKYVT